MDRVALNSRYNTRSNILVKVGENRYKLETKLSYRCGRVSADKKFVDPSGGPMITEGGYLHDIGKTVKRIDFVQGEGTFIEFE